MEGNLLPQTEIFPWYTCQTIWVLYHKYQKLFLACTKKNRMIKRIKCPWQIQQCKYRHLSPISLVKQSTDDKNQIWRKKNLLLFLSGLAISLHVPVYDYTAQIRLCFEQVTYILSISLQEVSVQNKLTETSSLFLFHMAQNCPSTGYKFVFKFFFFIKGAKHFLKSMSKKAVSV